MQGSANVANFIKQIVYGLDRYKLFFQDFLELIFKHNHANRLDRTIIKIFAYLILFKFFQLPFRELKAFIKSQKPLTMQNLL